MTSQGVVAIGDSIVNGHGDMLLGVQCQSAALWLAQAGDWAFTKYAVGGSTSQRIVDEQLPRLGGDYAVGVMNMGANDVLFDYDADRLAANLDQAAKAMRAVCEHVVILTLPAVLGQVPGAPPVRRQRVAQVNELIRSTAATHELLVLDVSDFHGPRLLRADRVHPTALGQLEIADRAAALLRSNGVAVPVQPSSIPLGHPDGRLRPGFLAGYARGSVVQSAKASAKRLLRR